MNFLRRRLILEEPDMTPFTLENTIETVKPMIDQSISLFKKFARQLKDFAETIKDTEEVYENYQKTFPKFQLTKNHIGGLLTFSKGFWFRVRNLWLPLVILFTILCKGYLSGKVHISPAQYSFVLAL